MNLDFFLLRAALLLFGLTLAGLATYLLTHAVKRLALRHHLLDRPNHRSSHTQPIPRLGGLAIIGGFLVGLLGFQILQILVPPLRWLVDQPQPFFLLSALFIGLVGAYDDLKGLTAWEKLGAQFMAALLVMTAGYRFDLDALPFLAGTAIGDVVTFLVTLLWIVGVMNAVNLIDGLDGLATGISIIAVTCLTLLSALRGYGADLVFVAVFLGALFGFLYHNRHPATIFMGDSGSLFLGFLLATFALPATNAPTAFESIIPILLILGIPLLDTTLAILRRTAAGQGLMTADRDHIHHRLRSYLGLSHRDAVLVLYTFSFIFGLLALILVAPLPANFDALTFLTCLGTGAYLLAKLGYLAFLSRSPSFRWAARLTRHPFPRRHPLQHRPSHT